MADDTNRTPAPAEIQQARDDYASSIVQIDPQRDCISRDDGIWVAAWTRIGPIGDVMPDSSLRTKQADGFWWVAMFVRVDPIPDVEPDFEGYETAENPNG